ncbi:amidohydrolase [Natroniella sulfidigena]|uniref:M20 metallopeptidase family protein n=1 Tax=Natroniella sulfidigena TaxID=723921 RepID=UPI00200B400F|nr:amidohydrolase [Natroniella sulfidigena]MCK8816139.1 amidohydrolase [Natroniella sulfidigena]
MKEVIEQIELIEQEVIELRREFHQYPELGFEEERTSQRISAYLSDLNLEIERIGKTGVVGLLDCGPGPTIALRADMDALPITEQTEVSYSSKFDGVMHACGHDGHTAILLGVAKVLTKIQDKIKGKIKFIFQPAEEGPGGALPLIKAGVLDKPEVDNIFGLHITNRLPTGVVGLQKEVVSAAADEIDLIIKGKSGHASNPQDGIDAIVTASQVITALQTINSRKVGPHQKVVINLGTIKGGYRRNVIADEVKVTGTVRTTDPDLRKSLPTMIEQIVSGVAASQGGDYQLDYRKGYPVLINSTELVESLEHTINQIPYLKEVEFLKLPSMGAEDFAYYLQHVPGIFFRLGAADANANYYPAHHPKFNFDEGALEIGIALFIYITLQRIKDNLTAL